MAMILDQVDEQSGPFTTYELQPSVKAACITSDIFMIPITQRTIVRENELGFGAKCDVTVHAPPSHVGVCHHELARRCFSLWSVAYHQDHKGSKNTSLGSRTKKK